MSDILSANTRNLYPTSGVATLGQAGSAGSPFVSGSAASPAATSTQQAGGVGMEPVTARAAAIGATGKPIPFWILIVLMLIAIGYLSQKFGSMGDDFKNIKLSAYNTIIITLSAVVGIAALKAIFNKHPVPGLTSLLNAV